MIYSYHTIKRESLKNMFTTDKPQSTCFTIFFLFGNIYLEGFDRFNSISNYIKHSKASFLIFETLDQFKMYMHACKNRNEFSPNMLDWH